MVNYYAEKTLNMMFAGSRQSKPMEESQAEGENLDKIEDVRLITKRRENLGKLRIFLFHL